MIHPYDMWYSPSQISLCGYYIMGFNGSPTRRPSWVEIQNIPKVDGNPGECVLVLVDGPVTKPLSEMDDNCRLLGPLSHPSAK